MANSKVIYKTALLPIVPPRTETIRKFKGEDGEDCQMVVRDGSHPTEYVKIRTCDGKLWQDFDVYIGDAIDNVNYKLPQSKWHNPFKVMRGKRVIQQDLPRYRKYVLETEHLRNSLPELKGARLGDFATPGIPNHGHVLCELANRPSAENGNEERQRPLRTLALYKGSSFVLSNSFLFNFQHLTHSFMSVEHAAAWEMARRLEYKADYTQNILHMKNPQRIAKIYNRLKAKLEVSEVIGLLLMLTNMKYHQLPAFRAEAVKYVNCLLAEGSTDETYGLGVDIANRPIFSDQDMSQFPGTNLNGAVVQYVITAKLKSRQGLDYWKRYHQRLESNPVSQGYLLVYEIAGAQLPKHVTRGAAPAAALPRHQKRKVKIKRIEEEKISHNDS